MDERLLKEKKTSMFYRATLRTYSAVLLQQVVRSNDAISGSIKSRMATIRHLGIFERPYLRNGQLSDPLIFSSMVRFSGSADGTIFGSIKPKMAAMIWHMTWQKISTRAEPSDVCLLPNYFCPCCAYQSRAETSITSWWRNVQRANRPGAKHLGCETSS